MRRCEPQQAAVTWPLKRILPDKGYKPSTFAFQMNAFCEEQRRSVLENSREPASRRYRFTESAMPPFVVVKRPDDGLINDRSMPIDDSSAYRRIGSLLPQTIFENLTGTASAPAADWSPCTSARRRSSRR